MYELIYRTLLLFWLFLMLTFSGDFTLLKSILLLMLLLISFKEILINKGKCYSYTYICFLVLWFVIILASYSHGIILGYQPSFSLFNYMLVTPFVAFILSAPINKRRMIFISNNLPHITLVIALLNLLYLLHMSGVIWFPDYILKLNSFGGVSFTDQKLELRLTSQPSLIFLSGYLMCSLIFCKNKAYVSFILFLCMLVAIVSGRKALQVLFFFNILLTLFLYVKYKKLTPRLIFKLISNCLLFFCCLIFCFEIISYFTQINSPVDSFLNTLNRMFDTRHGGGEKRYTQSIHLFNFFADNVFFGNGLNSHPDYLRSSTEPWSYEWVYLSWLAQNGIFISLFIAFCFSSVIVKSYKAYTLSLNQNCQNAVFYAGTFTGGLSFIIAGSTNPMIYFLWFWFLMLIPFNIIKR